MKVLTHHGHVSSLCVIVPATNNPATLHRCTSAIEHAHDPPEELIVVRGPENAGPAAARNDGAQRATSEVLVFVDADVHVHRDVFVRIRDAFDTDSTLAAVFGSYDDAPAARGTVTRFRNLLHHFVHQSAAGQASTFWAGLGAIRREVFLAAGGFDSDRYRDPSIEDIELGMRLSDAGRKIVLDPAIQGTHLKRWTIGGMLTTDLIHRGAPWVELLLEHRDSSRALNLGWRHRLSAGCSVAAAAALVGRRPGWAAVSLAGLVLLNASFYRLLWRRQGPASAVAGVGLHGLHHLTGVAALPAGLVMYLFSPKRRDAPRRRRAAAGADLEEFA